MSHPHHNKSFVFHPNIYMLASYFDIKSIVSLLNLIFPKRMSHPHNNKNLVFTPNIYMLASYFDIKIIVSLLKSLWLPLETVCQFDDLGIIILDLMNWCKCLHQVIVCLEILKLLEHDVTHHTLDQFIHICWSR